MTGVELSVVADAETLARTVAEQLLDRLVAIQAEGRVPSIAVTGGTIANEIYRALARLDSSVVDWTQVDLWWGDERYVPASDEDRNAKQAWEAMLSHLDVSPGRVHEMPASDGPHETVQDAATAYGDQVRERSGRDPPCLGPAEAGVPVRGEGGRHLARGESATRTGREALVHLECAGLFEQVDYGVLIGAEGE